MSANDEKEVSEYTSARVGEQRPDRLSRAPAHWRTGLEGRPANSPGRAPLDEKIVVHVDPDLADLIPGFLENRQKDVQALQQALRTGDYATIGKLGHQMKGIGGGYGFDALSDIGCALEQAAKRRIADEIRERLQELVDYLAHVVVSYA